jgi:hypothetical protein
LTKLTRDNKNALKQLGDLGQGGLSFSADVAAGSPAMSNVSRETDETMKQILEVLKTLSEFITNPNPEQ